MSTKKSSSKLHESRIDEIAWRIYDEALVAMSDFDELKGAKTDDVAYFLRMKTKEKLRDIIIEKNNR